MKKLKRLPKQIYVAVSGGVDSVAMLHFLKAHHDVTVVHYIHDSEYADVEHAFVKELCLGLRLPLLTEQQPNTEPTGESREQYWRRGRYEFFNSLPGVVCVGTTLDDAVEWYLFSCLRGQGHYMKYANGNVVKPFLATRKQQLVEYAQQNNISWIEDPSNSDINFARRNRIRACLVPEVEKIEPGIYNIVKQRIVRDTHTGDILPRQC